MRVSPALRTLAGLVLGLALDVLAARSGGWPGVVAVATTAGGLWLDALRMTIVPLVFALVVTGVASALATGRRGGVAARALPLFALILVGSAVVGALLGGALLGSWTPPALSNLGAGLTGPVPSIPPASEALRGLIPANPVAAAASGAVAPLALFALLFGVALGRLDPARADPVLNGLRTIVDALLVIVRWVLMLAPVGVLALAFATAARVGAGLGTALAFYVGVQIAVTVALGVAMVALAATIGPTGIGRFARAAAPAQAVAFATQSSLASLPAMLTATETLGLAAGPAGVVLPLAVALFRIAAPASIAVAVLALAKLHGLHLGAAQYSVLVALAALNTLVITGLPNQITFFAAYAPPALAIGVPIELLPLLLAVDALPDMFYTASNVTADLSVAAVLNREDGETTT